MNVLEQIMQEIDNAIDENMEYIYDENGVHRFVLNSEFVRFITKEIIKKHLSDDKMNLICIHEKYIKDIKCARKEFLEDCKRTAEKYKKKDTDNIYSLPVSERKNKFLELLSQTTGDTESSARREEILKEYIKENISENLPYKIGSFVEVEKENNNYKLYGEIVGYTVYEDSILVWVSGYKESWCGEFTLDEIKLLTDEEVKNLLNERSE